MHDIRGRGRLTLLAVALALAVAGCRREAPPEEAAPAGDDGVVEGLSSEQIEARAEAMSPEQAERLGIVDTSIHVERLTSPEDSALIPDSARVPERP